MLMASIKIKTRRIDRMFRRKTVKLLVNVLVINGHSVSKQALLLACIHTYTYIGCIAKVERGRANAH